MLIVNLNQIIFIYILNILSDSLINLLIVLKIWNWIYCSHEFFSFPVYYISNAY
jgi:hypothetical protein